MRIPTFISRIAKIGPLQRPAVRASLWTFGAYGISQVLRLASNLILAYLLKKHMEVFGIMFIVNVIMQGFQMLSDLGLGPSIIQSPRGEQKEFLWTAFTIQFIRGVCLWVAACALAWPLASFFGQPILLAIIPVISITAVIDGLGSPNYAVMNRRLNIGPMMLIELAAYVISVVVMIIGAWFSRTVWPLVIGGIVCSLCNVIFTHVFLEGPRMRFHINREYAREILHFGKWLFLSSLLTFFAGQLDKIVLGRYLMAGPLGIYSIAFMLSQVLIQVISRLSTKVLFPLYSSTAKQSSRELRHQTFRVRGLLLLGSLPPMWLLIFIAPELINLLYPVEFHAGGWKLQLLAIGATAQCIFYPVEAVLLAVGNSYRHMLLQFLRSVIMFVAMIAGGYYWGTAGLIMGVVASQFLHYPVLVALIRKYGVWLPTLDFMAVAVSALVIAGGLMVRAELGFPVFWHEWAPVGELLERFDDLDTDDNSALSLNEVRGAVPHFTRILFERIDLDASQEINLEEIGIHLGEISTETEEEPKS